MPIQRNYTRGLTTRTVGSVVTEARALLNDVAPSQGGNTLSGSLTGRNINELMLHVRAMLGDMAPDNGNSWSATESGHNVASVIYEARTLLNDTVPSPEYRYSTADLYTYFNTAMLNVRRVRPDLFVTAYNVALPLYFEPQGAAMFPLFETVIPAVAYFIAGQAEIRDDSTGTNEHAAMLLGQFGKVLEQTPFRYSDIFLYELLNRAVLHARRLRPDLFSGALANLSAAVPIYAPSDLGEPFPVDDSLFPVFAAYMIDQARKRDAVMTGKEMAGPQDGGLQDALMAAPARHTDADLYRFVADALAETRDKRPDLFLPVLREMLPPVYGPLDAEVAFPVDDRYLPAFAHYVAAKALMRGVPVMRAEAVAAHMGAFIDGVRK